MQLSASYELLLSHPRQSFCGDSTEKKSSASVMPELSLSLGDSAAIVMNAEPLRPYKRPYKKSVLGCRSCKARKIKVRVPSSTSYSWCEIPDDQDNPKKVALPVPPITWNVEYGDMLTRILSVTSKGQFVETAREDILMLPIVNTTRRPQKF